jgi:hypothetical protein
MKLRQYGGKFATSISTKELANIMKNFLHNKTVVESKRQRQLVGLPGCL